MYSVSVVSVLRTPSTGLSYARFGCRMPSSTPPGAARLSPTAQTRRRPPDPDLHFIWRLRGEKKTRRRPKIPARSRPAAATQPPNLPPGSRVVKGTISPDLLRSRRNLPDITHTNLAEFRRDLTEIYILESSERRKRCTMTDRDFPGTDQSEVAKQRLCLFAGSQTARQCVASPARHAPGVCRAHVGFGVARSLDHVPRTRQAGFIYIFSRWPSGSSSPHPPCPGRP